MPVPTPRQPSLLTKFFSLACSLAGALGLERLTEALIGALAEAAGVSQPAQPGTPAEAKQVAALEGLLQLATGPRAGLLGSGWVLVLRTLSALEALQVSQAGPICSLLTCSQSVYCTCIGCCRHACCISALLTYRFVLTC